MLSPDVFLLFLTTSLLLCLAPGPDNIFVLTQSMLRGTVSGFLVTLGLCTGLLVHTSAVALGVAVIFQQSLLAFTILKLCGAAYLLYLAWGAFRAGASGLGTLNASSLDKMTLYRRGIFMNITNPKVSIFFLAFLPQFTDPSRGHLTLQLLELGAVFIVCTLLVFGLISLLAGKVGNWFSQSPKAEVMMNRVAGSVFAALAIKLAFTQR
ncbi:LysE family translocator [Tolumonas osonensis]|uniref:Threonine/homoserine/homoserine lactone efflux protein n=1 Tax=Tolumonas osonensis TaxID=675874 RepID=A0A841G614_9GAMM|nr:LysE family translocator [Tolumonas osonensis]MBB6054288.1 threonine/homoserine/homoserine lactone efflux protein [Tolumonas osonensis]